MDTLHAAVRSGMDRAVAGRRAPVRQPGVAALALLLAIALLAACTGRGSGGSPDPDAAGRDPSGSAAGLVAAVKVTEPGPARGAYVNPGETVPVGTGPVRVTISFRGAVDRQAVEGRLRVTGAAAPPRLAWPQADLLLLEFPAGAAGEQVTVTLEAGIPLPAGGTTAAGLTFGFRRLQPAGVTVLLDGRPLPWPHPAGRAYLPVSGEVTLEFRFDKPVHRESVSAALQADRDRGRFSLTWDGDQRAILTLSAPVGTEVRLSLDGATDRDGVALTLPGGPVTLRWGRQTAIVAVGLTGGAGQPVLTLPHALAGALAAPTGGRIAYLEDEGRPGRYRLWIADPGGGSPWDTGLYVAGPERLAWLQDRRLLVAGEEGLALADAGRRTVEQVTTGPVAGFAASAGGRLIAWLTARRSPDGGAIYDVHYRETSQGTTGVQTEVLRLPVGWSDLIPMALSHDARRLVIGASPSPVPAATLLATDGSAIRELSLPREVAAGALAFSPSGDLLLAGAAVVDVASGTPVAALDGARRAVWAPGSNRVAYSLRPDGGPLQVWVADLGSGARSAIGPGEVAGWLSNSQVLVFQP